MGFQIVEAASLSDSGSLIEPEELYHAMHLLQQYALFPTPSKEWIDDLKLILARASREVQELCLQVLRTRIFSRAGSPCRNCALTYKQGFSLSDEGWDCASCAAVVWPLPQFLTQSHPWKLIGEQTQGLTYGADCAAALSHEFTSVMYASTTVTLIDRYGAADYIRRASKVDSGLQRLLSLAAQYDVQRVEIYVGCGSKVNGKVLRPQDIEHEFKSHLSRSPKTQLQIHILTEKAAKQKMHDRWLGFQLSSTGAISYGLGKGISQYDGASAHQAHQVARHSDHTVDSIRRMLQPDIQVSKLL